MGPMGPRGLGPIKQKCSYYVVIIILTMMRFFGSWPGPLALALDHHDHDHDHDDDHDQDDFLFYGPKAPGAHGAHN